MKKHQTKNKRPLIVMLSTPYYSAWDSGDKLTTTQSEFVSSSLAYIHRNVGQERKVSLHAFVKYNSHWNCVSVKRIQFWHATSSPTTCSIHWILVDKTCTTCTVLWSVMWTTSRTWDLEARYLWPFLLKLKPNQSGYFVSMSQHLYMKSKQVPVTKLMKTDVHARMFRANKQCCLWTCDKVYHTCCALYFHLFPQRNT